ncbi:hypothetical protein SAMN05421753_11150 [Planctomicrobium piriforme]|uniref:Uncharacterized protein n=1 Tax=Planctomicrobium piriforme TaxID=1576369 RepID=A0A1I3JXS5_9PLAN|nr:hypothetical protein SAMN05421753_11150 [Planctomicrobium piriforme]
MVTICDFSAVATGQEEVNVDAVKAVLSSVKESIFSIRKGVCNVSADYDYSVLEKGKWKDSSYDYRYFIAFDDDDGMIRYDRINPLDSGRPEQVVLTPSLGVGAPADSTRRNSDGSDPSRVIGKFDPSQPGDMLKKNLIDPVIMPLLPERAFAFFTNQRKYRDRVLGDNITAGAEVLMRTGDDGRVVVDIHWQHPVERELSLELDSRKGYRPLMRSSRHRGTVSGEWSTPDVVKTQWTKQNDVYVPSRIEVSGEDTEHKASLLFSLDWSSVNEPVDPSLFTLDAMHPQDGDEVVQVVGDKMVLEEVIGSPSPPQVREQLTRRGSQGLSLWFLVTFNVVVVVAIVVWYLVFRR